MVYQIVAALFLVVAIIAVVVSARLLFNRKWLAGFLRGFSGIFLLAFAIFAALAGKDIYSYKSASGSQEIVRLSFHKKEANNYLVELQQSSGVFSTKEIEGQQWQLNVRMFKWPPLLGAVGLGAGYRLENISGRFIELQLDKMVGRKEPQGLNEGSMLDTWSLLQLHPSALPFVTAYMATPGFIPMADAAIYQVMPSGQNLIVNPLNDVAENALASW